MAKIIPNYVNKSKFIDKKRRLSIFTDNLLLQNI